MDDLFYWTKTCEDNILELQNLTSWWTQVIFFILRQLIVRKVQCNCLLILQWLNSLPKPRVLLSLKVFNIYWFRSTTSKEIHTL